MPADTPTVVVIDDDPTIRLLLTAGLSRQGYRVVEAPNGVAGLEAFRRECPDVMLVDVRMPGMDGYAVAEAVRKLPGGATLPVVMLTGSDDAETERLARQAGATAVMSKPFALLTLVERLQALLDPAR